MNMQALAAPKTHVKSVQPCILNSSIEFSSSSSVQLSIRQTRNAQDSLRVEAKQLLVQCDDVFCGWAIAVVAWFACMTKLVS